MRPRKNQRSYQKILELESRIKNLEDLRDIQELKTRYCYYIDNRQWALLAGIFSEKGTIDCGEFGKANGREEIQKFFSVKISDLFSFFIHMVHNPLIELHGDTASGTWYWTEPSVYRADGLARFIQGRYDESYVKEGGNWKFKSVVLSLRINTPFDFSWDRKISNKDS